MRDTKFDRNGLRLTFGVAKNQLDNMARGRTQHEQLENALVERLDRLERRIHKLREEQEAVRAALQSHRRDRLRFKGAIRKNSFSKLLVEKRIQEALRKRKGRMSTEQLYEAIAIIGDEEMPKTTFRSHLHRMKSEGLIVSPTRGSYELAVILD